jgi:hypothetical protein
MTLGCDMRQFWWHGSDSPDGPVQRRSADAKKFSQLGLGLATEVVQFKQVLRLVVFWLVAGRGDLSYRLGGGGGGGSAGVLARQGARHSAASQPSMM